MSSAICFNLDQSNILSSGNCLSYFEPRVPPQIWLYPMQISKKEIFV